MLSVADESFRADAQTDTMKPTVAFCNFAKAPKNLICHFKHSSTSFILHN
jgi:hypothetical protein